MSFDLSGKRVAVLGAGKMGGILLKALLEKGLLSPKATFATVHHEDRARALAEKLGVSVGTDNLAAVRNAELEASAQVTANSLRVQSQMAAGWRHPGACAILMKSASAQPHPRGNRLADEGARRCSPNSS